MIFQAVHTTFCNSTDNLNDMMNDGQRCEEQNGIITHIITMFFVDQSPVAQFLIRTKHGIDDATIYSSMAVALTRREVTEAQQ